MVEKVVTVMLARQLGKSRLAAMYCEHVLASQARSKSPIEAGYDIASKPDETIAVFVDEAGTISEADWKKLEG